MWLFLLNINVTYAEMDFIQYKDFAVVYCFFFFYIFWPKNGLRWKTKGLSKNIYAMVSFRDALRSEFVTWESTNNVMESDFFSLSCWLLFQKRQLHDYLDIVWLSRLSFQSSSYISRSDSFSWFCFYLFFPVLLILTIVQQAVTPLCPLNLSLLFAIHFSILACSWRWNCS